MLGVYCVFILAGLQLICKNLFLFVVIMQVDFKHIHLPELSSNNYLYKYV